MLQTLLICVVLYSSVKRPFGISGFVRAWRHYCTGQVPLYMYIYLADENMILWLVEQMQTVDELSKLVMNHKIMQQTACHSLCIPVHC